MSTCYVGALLTTFILAVAEARVYRLPIVRTTVEVDWQISDRPIHLLSLQERYLATNPTRHSSDADVHLLAAPDISSQGRLNHAPESGEDCERYPCITYWSMYTISISVGNPPINLTALVDTSWNTFFVPSVNCTYNWCVTHPSYNSTASFTYEADGRPVDLEYFSGSSFLYADGKVSRDSVHLGGVEIKKQVVEEATEMMQGDAPLFRDELFDTALGLALHPRSIEKGGFEAASPFQELMEQKLLENNLFSLKLSREDGEAGELTLGGLPEGLEQRDLTVQVPLDHTKPGDGGLPEWLYYAYNGWQVSVVNVSMETSDRNISTHLLSSPVIAVVSSSWPYITLPKDAVAEANRQLGLSKEFDWVDCSLRPDLPNLTIAFGPSNSSITLTPWDYLIEFMDLDYWRWRCVSSFVALPNAGDYEFIILGNPFLTGLYSVFDAANETISFVNRPW